MQKNRMDNRGFTLMELLVAVTLFSVLLVMLTDIFLLSVRAQRKAFFGSTILSDSRFILGIISDAVRSGQIDYDYAGYSGGIPSQAQELVLRDSFGKRIIFRKTSDEGVCPSPLSVPCVEMLIDDGISVSSASVSSKDAKVIDLKFNIFPETNPFRLVGGSYSANNQPVVTVNLGLRGISPKELEGNPLYSQTTISSRMYGR